MRSSPLLSFIVPIFAWHVPLVPLIFLKRSLVIPILFLPLFLCTDHWGRLSYLSLLVFGNLHSVGYVYPFLLCLSLLFFIHLFVRPSQIIILPFCISFPLKWLWSLPTVQYYEPPSTVLQALYQILSLESICHFDRIIIRIWFRSYLNSWVVFPYFLQFKSEFYNKKLMIWATVSSRCCFY